MVPGGIFPVSCLQAVRSCLAGKLKQILSREQRTSKKKTLAFIRNPRNSEIHLFDAKISYQLANSFLILHRIWSQEPTQDPKPKPWTLQVHFVEQYCDAIYKVACVPQRWRLRDLGVFADSWWGVTCGCNWPSPHRRPLTVVMNRAVKASHQIKVHQLPLNCNIKCSQSHTSFTTGCQKSNLIEIEDGRTPMNVMVIIVIVIIIGVIFTIIIIAITTAAILILIVIVIVILIIIIINIIINIIIVNFLNFMNFIRPFAWCKQAIAIRTRCPQRRSWRHPSRRQLEGLEGRGHSTLTESGKGSCLSAGWA